MRFRVAADIFRRVFRGRNSRPPTGPSGRALDRARSIAFVLQQPDHASRHQWPDAARVRGANVDLLPLNQPYRRSDGAPASFLYTAPRAEYDCIVVDRQINLFEHSWSYAFLERVNALLAKDGAAIVPRCTNPARQIPDGALEALFGRAPVEKGKHYLTFAKAPNGLHRPPEAAYSTLDAYWDLMPNLIEHDFERRLKKVIGELGVARPAECTGGNYDLITALKSQSYRTTNVCAKAALMQFVIAQCLPGRSNLHLADVGAGTALNSLEILLNPAGVSSLTLIEISERYHWPIAAMYEHLGERVRGKVALVGDPGQGFTGRPADVAMVCEVFSLLPRGDRDAFARNIWDNLAPGGIFAVLENMRVASGERYDRYTPPEIDALLAQFGPARYFSGRAKKELAAGEVGNLPVFRVVRKPA